MLYRRSNDMSLNEKKRHKQLPDIYLTEGICRSKSFAGLSHRRTNSADATFSSGADLAFDSSPGLLRSGLGAVFGQSTARTFIHGLSSSKSSKLHKAPHPERMQTIFDTISKGLKDSILLAQNDISSSRVAFDNVSVTSVLQVKVNERLLKKLEFHLSKLEELKEQYDVQHRMRDGIRGMAYAYILSPGKEKESALQSVKMQFKECTELMCSLESKLEELMGTFLFEMKGIQGFARICSGDVFEVVIRHGEQKWKSRGRVVKNGEQLWENKFILFKSLFNDPLCIKAVEVRGLGKNILLGNKFCEIHDLFSAHPQQMTINLNPSGSLKLNLIITWNPLSCSADGMNMSTLPSSAGMPYSYGRNSISQSSIQEAEAFSELSLSAKEGLLHNSNFCDNTGQSFSSESTSASVSAQSSAIASPDVEVMSRACQFVDSSLTQCEPNTLRLSHRMPKDPNLNDSQAWSIPASEENSECRSISSSDSHLHRPNLSEALKSLINLVEDVPESYPETKELSSVLEEINRLLKGNDSSSSGSNISISVESALGCFDFLNSAIENEELDAVDKLSEDTNIKVSEQNTISDMQMVSEDQNLPCKLNLNSLSISSGNEQVDAILIDHLLYCAKLISVLIASGPVKPGENRTLMKLQKQIQIFCILLNVMKKNNVFLLHDFFEENECNVQHLWNTITGDALYCTSDHFCFEIENIIKSKAVLDSYMASIVCPRLICEILDSNQYDPSSRISVLQFKTYFAGHHNPDAVICEFVADILAAEDLKSRDIQRAFAAVSVLSKINPSSHCLFLIGCLLTETDIDLKNIATCFLKAVAANSVLKKKVISSYIEMLMSEDASSRLTACAALNVLEAKHCAEQLMHIANNDIDANVREAANSALDSLKMCPTVQETS